jgi:MoaA/NifB/PqqE/SkfB family radical SAM enzyme
MNNLKQYGFHDYLSPEFPSQIIVDVTELCNYACIHCPHHIFEKSSKYSGKNLDLGLHKKLIDEIATDGKGYCRYIRYTGLGETLLHPNFVEMIKYAAKYAGAPINVTTNGLLLTKDKARKLLDAEVNTFDISIDAYFPETYRKIRRNGDLSRVRNNCLNLIKMIKVGGYKAKLVVSFIEQPLNENEKNKFKEFWKNNGSDFVVIRPMHSASGSIKAVAKKMKEYEQKRRPCLYPWERLILSPTGKIGFCPAEWKYKAEIANFNKATIKAIWQGSFMQSLRKAHLNNDFTEHRFCGQCPDWAVTRWPLDGRNYSSMMQELFSKDLINEG